MFQALWDRSHSRRTYVQRNGQTDSRPQRVASADPLKHEHSASEKQSICQFKNMAEYLHITSNHAFSHNILMLSRNEYSHPKTQTCCWCRYQSPWLLAGEETGNECKFLTDKSTLLLTLTQQWHDAVLTAFVERATKCLATADFWKYTNTELDQGKRSIEDSSRGLWRY